MNLQFPDENNIKFEDNYSSHKKDINKNLQNEYLIKYQKIYGNSFSDIELLNIFNKNNYNEEKIINDINSLLMTNGKNNDNDIDNNNNERHYSPSFAKNINSKNINSKISIRNIKYDKNDKLFLQKNSEIPSDYGPPPKNEENNKVLNNNILLEYKKNLFDKLRQTNNTYKINRHINEELNFDEIMKGKTELKMNKQKEIETMINESYKNNDNSNIINTSPNFKSKKNIIKNINKDKKIEYIKIFFGNMKNYTISPIKRNKKGRSPNYEKKKNNLDISPNKTDLVKEKVFTYKKGIRANYSRGKKAYNNKYLKINKKVNDIYISACYDNPQREQFLKIYNEKRKENPDKVIELIIPQIPSMPSLPFYSNVYSPYNQFNPYMNMYMIPSPIQYPTQNVLNSQIINNKSFNNSNNMEAPNNNSQTLNSVNNPEIMKVNNNQINQLNNNSNTNSFLVNNIGMNNISNNKSFGNISNNSGIINTTSSCK